MEVSELALREILKTHTGAVLLWNSSVLYPDSY